MTTSTKTHDNGNDGAGSITDELIKAATDAGFSLELATTLREPKNKLTLSEATI